MEIDKAKKIFCSGIGGIGISAVARILREQGKSVSGSDNGENEIIDQLRQEGVEVFVPQRAENIAEDTDLLIYSVAVPAENPERRRAEELGIEQITYPQALGQLLNGKYGIGVSGTNGKTTTTAMLGKIFLEGGLDPTIVVGSKVDYLGGNSRVGGGEYFIFESDEYRRAFDNYQPKIAVVTYVTSDHLDYYLDLEDIKAAFGAYLQKIPAGGVAIINADDQNSLDVAAGIVAKVITFGIENKADYSAQNIRMENGRQIFDVFAAKEKLGEIALTIPAKYNIYNALAAVAACRTVGISFTEIESALESFRGAWRRFEQVGETSGGVKIVTDYAHTPDALKQTILAARDFYPDRKILTVFQPHQFNRTKVFFKEFVAALSAADKSLVTDIFFVAGRENPEDFDVSSEKMAAAVAASGGNCVYSGDLRQTEELVQQNIRDFDIILVIGAGNIYELAKNLINK